MGKCLGVSPRIYAWSASEFANNNPCQLVYTTLQRVSSVALRFSEAFELNLVSILANTFKRFPSI